MNINQALNWASNELKEIETAELDARVLLCFILKISQLKIIINKNELIKNTDLIKYKQIILKRKKRIPVAYLTKTKEFWGLDFYVNKNVLIPRPETEILVEESLEFIKTFKKNKIEILDLGTGSGCIAVSLARELKEKNIKYQITAIDKSEKALSIGRKNANNHLVKSNIRFIKGNWFEKVGKKKFDLIISNPPYVNRQLNNLSPELEHEPGSALFAENEGLEDIFKIIDNLSNHLIDKGSFFCEIGAEQRDKISLYCAKKDFELEFKKDLSGKTRILKLVRKSI